MKKNLSSLISHLSFQEGFTLIELLVTIAIIGILSSFLLANFIGVRQRARDGVRKSDLRQIQSALELYRSDKSEYPTAAQFPATCGAELSSGGTIYMKKIPCDPMNSGKYVYTYSSSDGITYYLYSCLENINDSQKDNPTNNSTYCDGGDKNWSYTLQNP